MSPGLAGGLGRGQSHIDNRRFDETASAVGVAVEMPRLYCDTTYPLDRPGVTIGTTYTVHSGDDLQAVINTAAASPPAVNVVDQIVLDQTATFTGNYTLPVRADDEVGGWIIIRTAGTRGGDLPGFGAGVLNPGPISNEDIVNGNYISPAVAPRIQPVTDTRCANFAKLVTPSVGAAIADDVGSSYWWLSCLEITGTPTGGGTDYCFGLTRFGGNELTIEAQCHHITIEACYIHSTDSPFLQCQHGVWFNGRYTAVVDSWIDDIYWVGVDAQGVSGFTGAGPLKASNNFVESTSENMVYGGNPTSIQDSGSGTFHPADFEWQWNHVFKRLSWIGDQGGGVFFRIKNHTEMKHGIRTVEQGNVLENNWVGADEFGSSALYYPAGDSGPVFSVHTDDLTFRWNIINNAPIGFNIGGWPYQSGVPFRRSSYHDNLSFNIGHVAISDSRSRCFWFTENITDLVVQHNTAVTKTTVGIAISLALTDGPFGAIPQANTIYFLDNILGVGSPDGIVECAPGGSGSDGLNAWAGSTWTFSHNLIFNDDLAPPDPRAPSPLVNTWVPTQADVMFDTDYSLLTGSPGLGTDIASDGADFLGANMPALLAFTAGVVIPK